GTGSLYHGAPTSDGKARRRRDSCVAVDGQATVAPAVTKVDLFLCGERLLRPRGQLGALLQELLGRPDRLRRRGDVRRLQQTVEGAEAGVPGYQRGLRLLRQGLALLGSSLQRGEGGVIGTILPQPSNLLDEARVAIEGFRQPLRERELLPEPCFRRFHARFNPDINLSRLRPACSGETNRVLAGQGPRSARLLRRIARHRGDRIAALER